MVTLQLVLWLLYWTLCSYEIRGFHEETFSIDRPTWMGLGKTKSTFSLKSSFLSCLSTMLVLGGNQMYCMVRDSRKWNGDRRAAACFYIRPFVTFKNDLVQEENSSELLVS